MSFAYHRSLAPIMWVFFALILVETAVVHLLVALWSPLAGVILSLLSLSALVWLVLLIRSFARLPVRIDDGILHWHCGSLRSLAVPLDQIAGLSPEWDGATVKARSTFNAALIAYPNVMIELKSPISLGRRQIDRLAHKLDDRDAFVAALPRLMRSA